LTIINGETTNNRKFNLYRTGATILLVSGLVVIILAFLNEPPALQIVLGFIGLGFLGLAAIPISLARLEKKTDEQQAVVLSRFNELCQEIQKLEKPEKSGVVIADVLNSSLKFYADYLNREKQEE